MKNIFTVLIREWCVEKNRKKLTNVSFGHREGSKKNPENPWSLTKPGGGGFSEGTSKPNPKLERLRDNF